MPHFTPQPHMVSRSAPQAAHTLTQNHPGPYGSGPMTTPAQQFVANNWYQWWNGPLGYTFGQRDAYGGGTEQGTDFGVPLNTQIRSPFVGTVVYSGYTGDKSLGYVVQVKTPGGGVWHFQHLNSSAVAVGNQVNVGTMLGVSGGAPGAYSSGPHIEVRYSPTFNASLANGTGVGGAFWSDGKWQNSLPVIQQTVGAPVQAQGTPTGLNPLSGGLGSVFAGIGGALSNFLGFASTSTSSAATGPSFTLPHVAIAPTADVTNFLVALDAFLEIVNPLDVPGVQTDTILGATFPDPISWITGVGFNIILDMSAFIWRAGMIVFGAYLCFKVANHFIDFKAIATGAAKTAVAAAPLLV